MTHKKLVYIILLNWNGWRDTAECINSLRRLDYYNYTIVIVDNGSTDESVEKLKKMHPDITIVQTGRNLGFGGGCNVGIKYALKNGADYIWLLNNDTIVDKKALTAMIEKAESNKKIGAVGSVLYYMDQPDRVQAWGGGYVNLWTGLARHFYSPVANERLQYITGASILLRREVIEYVGGFDDQTFFMYWEDTDLSFRLRNKGWQLAVAEQSHIWHKESASLGKRSAVLDKYFNTSAVRFLKRYAPLPLIPIAISIGGRLIKRMLKGDNNNMKAVWEGFIQGMAETG